MGNDFIDTDFPNFIVWFIPVLIAIPLSMLWSTRAIKKAWGRWSKAMDIGFGISAGVGSIALIIMYVFWSTAIFIYWRHAFGQVGSHVRDATLILSMVSVLLSFFWNVLFIGGPGIGWIIGSIFSFGGAVAALGSVVTMGVSVGQKHTPNVLIASLVLMILYFIMITVQTIMLSIMAIYRAGAFLLSDDDKEAIKSFLPGMSPWNGRQTQFNGVVPTQINRKGQTLINRIPTRRNI